MWGDTQDLLVLKKRKDENKKCGFSGSFCQLSSCLSLQPEQLCSFKSSEDVQPLPLASPVPRGRRLIPFIKCGLTCGLPILTCGLTWSSHRHPLEVYFTSHMCGYVFINIHLIIFYFGAFLHTLKSNLKTPKMSDYQPPELTSVNQTGTAVGKCYYYHIQILLICASMLWASVYQAGYTDKIQFLPSRNSEGEDGVGPRYRGQCNQC